MLSYILNFHFDHNDIVVASHCLLIVIVKWSQGKCKKAITKYIQTFIVQMFFSENASLT